MPARFHRSLNAARLPPAIDAAGREHHHALIAFLNRKGQRAAAAARKEHRYIAEQRQLHRFRANRGRFTIQPAHDALNRGPHGDGQRVRHESQRAALPAHLQSVLLSPLFYACLIWFELTNAYPTEYTTPMYTILRS